MNILLFVPYGILVPRPARAVGGAVLLSLAIEFARVFIHSRMSSVTDVFMNTLGAAVGVAIADPRKASRQGPTPEIGP